MKFRRNKFNNKRVGKFDSMAEAEYGALLDLMVMAGDIKGFKHHPPAVQLSKSVKWRVDFLIEKNDGSSYYVEVKGCPTEGYKLKLALYEDNSDRLPGLMVVKKVGRMSFRAIAKVNM